MDPLENPNNETPLGGKDPHISHLNFTPVSNLGVYLGNFGFFCLSVWDWERCLDLGFILHTTLRLLRFFAENPVILADSLGFLIFFPRFLPFAGERARSGQLQVIRRENRGPHG